MRSFPSMTSCIWLSPYGLYTQSLLSSGVKPVCYVHEDPRVGWESGPGQRTEDSDYAFFNPEPSGFHVKN